MGPFAKLYNTLSKFDATGQTGTNGTVVISCIETQRTPLKNHPEVKLRVTLQDSWRGPPWIPNRPRRRPESHLSAKPRSNDWVCDGWAGPSQPGTACHPHPQSLRGASQWVSGEQHGTTSCPIKQI